MMVDLVRISDNVEQGAQGGPTFNTTVISLANGREARNQEWQIARHSWNIGYGITTPEEFQGVRDFFYERRGRARSFLFKDWSDYQSFQQPVATTNAGNKRQLIKTYGATNPYARLINYPVDGTLKVYIDTVLTAAYTVGLNGVLTFTDGDPGVNVVATCEFDIAVRFDVDQMAVTFANFLSVEIPSLTLIEVPNDDE